MPNVEQQWQKMQQLQVTNIVRVLLAEFGALTDYRVVRDSLPGRLVALLVCRCVLLYQRIGETLQLVAGSFDDEPGWSASLLAVAHINPIDVGSDGLEARAWRERHVIGEPEECPTLVALPLTYRQRGIGIMVALRGNDEKLGNSAMTWAAEELCGLDVVADVVALLLENTRLLERDRERIHELSLLNTMSNQMNGALYEPECLRSIIVQRAQEVSLADLCVLLEPAMPVTATAWITPALHALLFQHFREQQAPLLIERPGESSDPRIAAYLQHLPLEIKTFFAVPLLNSQETARRDRSAAETAQESVPVVPGILVGAYRRVWTVRREEMVVLQVLANQASAVLKNVQLMAELVEARNEARKLLRRVLDDQRLKALILASVPSGLITTDLNGHIVTFNKAAEAILGYHSYEVLGQPWQQFLHIQENTVQAHTEYKREIIHKNECTDVLASIQRETLLVLNRRGEEVIVEVDVLPLWGDPGERLGWLITFVDITLVRRLEEDKRRLDRLAVLGEMSANVAHEVRNPLASIKTAMQMLASEIVSGQVSNGCGKNDEQMGVQEWALESIDVVLKEVERLDTIVRELLQFARPRQLQRSVCTIEEVSDRVLHLLQRQCSEANIVVQRMYTSVPALYADVAQMEQVLLNLYMNAIQAMPDGGRLTVACRLIAKKQAICEGRRAQEVPLSLAVGEARELRGRCEHGEEEDTGEQWLELAVSDTGPGIAPEGAERIFQPFFTTRAHGIGLGLAITRRLVEDHGGYIWVGGQPGYGAVLAVRLPLLSEVYGANGEENDGHSKMMVRGI
jgi:PAS domain S-box-containing protein